MPMPADEVIATIKQAIPDAKVELKDLAGDQDHYHATVISEIFSGMTRIQQHKLVYNAFGGKVGGVLHALSLTTKTA
jgi:stress-induced morphogen